MTPFDYVTSILKKEQYIDDISAFALYITNKLFSNDKQLVSLANIVNKIGVTTLPKRALYDYYYFLIPKSNKFIKYPKKQDEFENIKYIMQYYEVNEEQAKTAIQFLNNDEINQIVNLFVKQGEIKNGKKSKKNK